MGPIRSLFRILRHEFRRFEFLDYNSRAFFVIISQANFPIVLRLSIRYNKWKTKIPAQ